MALTIKYFSPAGAGTKSGADVANATQAITGTAWATGFTGLAIGTIAAMTPGIYLVNATYAMTNTPTRAAPIIFHGCDNSGNLLQPSRGTSNILLDTTNYPKIQLSGDISFWFAAKSWTHFKCIHLRNIANTALGATPMNATSNCMFEGCTFCSFEPTNAGDIMNCGASCLVDNCDFIASGGGVAGTLLSCTTIGNVKNCVFISDTAQNYPNVALGLAPTYTTNCIFINLQNVLNTTSTTPQGSFENNIIYNCSGSAFIYGGASAASNTVGIQNNAFYNVSGYIVKSTLDNLVYISNNVVTNVASGITNQTFVTGINLIYTAPVTDFVNPSALDFRLAPNATILNSDCFRGNIGPTSYPFVSAVAGG